MKGTGVAACLSKKGVREELCLRRGGAGERIREGSTGTVDTGDYQESMTAERP